MEEQLNLFFGFLENDKKVSNNTLQSYKRDLKQFEKYIKENGKDYSKITHEEIKTYIESDKMLSEEVEKMKFKEEGMPW